MATFKFYYKGEELTDHRHNNITATGQGSAVIFKGKTYSNWRLNLPCEIESEAVTVVASDFEDETIKAVHIDGEVETMFWLVPYREGMSEVS